MPDDDETTEAGRWASRFGRARPRHPRYRWAVFLVIGLLAGVVGWIFFEMGSPARESATQTLEAPQVIGVYVSGNNVPIHLITHIGSNCNKAAAEQLILTVPQQSDYSEDKIIVTSSQDDHFASDVQGHLYTGVKVNIGAGRPMFESVFATTVGNVLAYSRPLYGLYGAQVGSFILPSAVQCSKGSTFVHLPELEPLLESVIPGTASSSAQVIAESSDGVIKSLTERPYVSASAVATGSGYWQPDPLTTAEDLVNFKPTLEASEISSNLPGPGTFLGNDDYVWQAQGTLEPTLTATSVGTSDSDAQDVLFAGIAFGIAAAALIAFLQELLHRADA